MGEEDRIARVIYWTEIDFLCESLLMDNTSKRKYVSDICKQLNPRCEDTISLIYYLIMWTTQK